VDNPLSLNRYTYVENNPLRFIDPSGHRPLEYAENSSDRVNSAMLGFENAAMYWARETVKWADATGEVPYDVVHEVVPAEYVEEVKDIVGWVAAGKWGREYGDMPDLGMATPAAGMAAAGTIKNTGKNVVQKANTTNGTSNIKEVFDSIKKAPKYPEGFQGVQNGTKKLNINNKQVLEELRNVEAGQWKKVYKDGYNASGKKVSIHYFESSSGKVFDVKVKMGWSNN